MEADAAGVPDGWLTAGVRGIGVASFLADLGHEIPTALLPDLLTKTLGASASALGLIEGLSDGLAGAARLGGGALADDPSRRRSIAVGGYTTTAILAAATASATGVWQVGVLRAGAWTARGLRVPARNALLADLVDPTAYGRAYGFERAMDNLGAIAGPLVAIWLVAMCGTRTAIAVSVLPGLGAALAMIYAIRRTATASHRQRTPVKLRIGPVLRTPGLGRLFVGISAFEFANAAATLLILRATELLGHGRSHDRAVTLALCLYVVYNAAATLTSVAIGRLIDRRGAWAGLVLGASAFAVAYLGLTVDTTHWVRLAPWFVLAGAAIGCAETSEHAAVAMAAPESIRGSAFGMLAATQSLGNVAASTIAGVLWTAASPSWAFAYLAATMAVATLLIARARTS